MRKGDRIALSGNTGASSGPHLHFQIDREEAPWHPYWPFTGTEARQAGMDLFQAVNAGLHSERGYEYTVHPMLYVQANYAAPTLVANGTTAVTHTSAPEATVRSTVSGRRKVVRRPTGGRVMSSSQRRSRAAERARSRLARRRFAPKETVVSKPAPVDDSPVVSRETVVSASLDAVPAPAPTVQSVSSITIEHDGHFSGRDWERVHITLLDADGNRIIKPQLNDPVYLRTAYGQAEFKPDVLHAHHFSEGVATVQMLPRGRRTIVVQAQPSGAISRPFQYSRR